MMRNVLFIACALTAGILIGYLFTTGSDQNLRSEDKDIPDAALPSLDAVAVPAAGSDSISALQTELRRADQAREQLAARLQALQRRVEELEQIRETEIASQVTTVSPNSQSENPAVVRTGLQALIEAGIGEDQAAWIQERLDEIELQQLYLRDRATREGWLNQPRYHKERRQYQNAVTELRGDIGDDAYDRVLYTLGRANRVAVRDILQNSPAAQYGLQQGDRIIEYDGQRIFTSNELSTVVTQGSAGVMTLLRVERDGRLHDIYVPRGPLGIRMTAARIAP